MTRILAGVQYLHDSYPASANPLIISWQSSVSLNHSKVITLLSRKVNAGIRQEGAISQLKKIVQAPHSPV